MVECVLSHILISLRNILDLACCFLVILYLFNSSRLSLHRWI